MATTGVRSVAALRFSGGWAVPSPHPRVGRSRPRHRTSHHGGSMIRPTRTMRVAAVFAAATLVLTACGSDSDSDSDKSDSGSKAAAKGDGTLTIGTLLPQTGDLAFLGPPEFAGVQAAVNEINEAGGVTARRSSRSTPTPATERLTSPARQIDKLLDAGRRRRRRRRVLERLQERHRQDHRCRRRPVLARQHRAGLRRKYDPTRACTSAPHRPTSCRARCRQPRGPGRQQERRRCWRVRTSTVRAAGRV